MDTHYYFFKHTISRMLIGAKYSIQPTRECVGFTVTRGALYHGHTHTQNYTTILYNTIYNTHNTTPSNILYYGCL